MFVFKWLNGNLHAKQLSTLLAKAQGNLSCLGLILQFVTPNHRTPTRSGSAACLAP
jgi:hypothetical protein